MCGIFGTISKTKINQNNLKLLAKHSEQRGKDSSGLMYYDDKKYKVFRADYDKMINIYQNIIKYIL